MSNLMKPVFQSDLGLERIVRLPQDEAGLPEKRPQQPGKAQPVRHLERELFSPDWEKRFQQILLNGQAASPGSWRQSLDEAGAFLAQTASQAAPTNRADLTAAVRLLQREQDLHDLLHQYRLGLQQA